MRKIVMPNKARRTDLSSQRMGDTWRKTNRLCGDLCEEKCLQLLPASTAGPKLWSVG